MMDRYPEFAFTYHAQYALMQNYQDMGRTGLITSAEAEEMTKDAFEQFLQKYPDCTMAGPAKDWLIRHNYND
jgi:outer membrane protein assembly factor BamD (BamD/ComL family)